MNKKYTACSPQDIPDKWGRMFDKIHGCSAIIFLSLSIVCTQVYGTPRPKQNHGLSINSAEDCSNIANKKCIIVLNAKEQAGYAKAIEALINVIQHQENGLREHDKFLGKLTYLYPKDPDKPIVFASYEDLLIFNRAVIGITRYQKDTPWTLAHIRADGIPPVFLTEFDKQIFATMKLVFLRTEAEEADKSKYFVYQTISSPKVLVKFYVKGSHLADGPDYPKNFDSVDFELVK